MILSTLSFLSATIFHGVAKTDLPPSRRSAALWKTALYSRRPGFERDLVLLQGFSHQRRVVDELLADLVHFVAGVFRRAFDKTLKLANPLQRAVGVVAGVNNCRGLLLGHCLLLNPPFIDIVDFQKYDRDWGLRQWKSGNTPECGRQAPQPEAVWIYAKPM
jgi:hypothetical protein